MNDEQVIEDFANLVLADYLDDGIEFCQFYEREDVPTGFGDDALLRVYDLANSRIRNLAHEVRNGEI